MRVSRIYKIFKDSRVFTIDDVRKEMSDLPSKAIRRNIETGITSETIGKVKRGLYYIIPPGTKKEEYKVDPCLVASRIRPDGVLCYSTAFSVHGRMHSLSNVMYVSSKSRFSSFIYQGISYKSVMLPELDFSVKKISYKGTSLRATTLERTIFDGLRRLKYMGGLEEFFHTLEAIPYLNREILEACIERFQSPSLQGKVGFFLELFQEQWGIPEEVIRKLMRRVPQQPEYLTSRKSRGVLIKKWNLIVPPSLKGVLKSGK
ncbi:hypothetical protein CH333_06925 [candidate division WOR-3 bacterium JGI_Cruoil_03_44_89]|uniref:AbiEi antitoxin C-terminal domain-containing protein n=1 Tax=candidate division WOR-3 bacterium JGI_Cruoil_03_44_89 TaxID=1973748 RepID=A0A235BRY3_UNCW3|nr:MAG: hypothetical protein CH333_06925 [candidate division WOR-3 bacterium JGI_Cruoil_03_44_89]